MQRARDLHAQLLVSERTSVQLQVCVLRVIVWGFKYVGVVVRQQHVNVFVER
jgi:hypothetical protein